MEEHQTEEQNAEDQQNPQHSTRKSPRTRSGVQDTRSTAKRSAKRKRSSKEPEAQPAKEPTPLPKFIDVEARDRFELISQKGFITQRKGNSHTELISRVNSVDITLTPDVVNSVLKTKIEDESTRKNFHETPVTLRTPRDQSMYVSPFTIHPRKSANKSFSSNFELATFIGKRNLLVPPTPVDNENVHQKEPRTEQTEPTPGTETTPEAYASSSQPKNKGKAPITEEATEEDDEKTEEEDQVDPE
ncbi:uncharacterized protein LOC113766428 [Coffea eugenioides]|uniref:uncharacterized protein LOC113766428 n=1 Tax=Coffea eugenioides TaxID=49369 RepID=UPI000F6132B0|nr:uncharacterized protein LOC113766428 [Coffea eugenioides]